MKPLTAKNDENIVRVQDLVRSDRPSTIRMIGEQLGLNHTTVHQILTNYSEMKMVPKNPSHSNFYQSVFGNQKYSRVSQQPPYSPDLGPCEFFLFPRLKIHPEG